MMPRRRALGSTDLACLKWVAIGLLALVPFILVGSAGPRMASLVPPEQSPAAPPVASEITPDPEPAQASGLRFSCSPPQLAQVEADMAAYLAELGIAPQAVVKHGTPAREQLTYTLNTPAEETSTLDLASRPEYGIAAEELELPVAKGTRRVRTVARAEILLALLQHGRLTELEGDSCSVAALRDMIGVRQNIVAWAEYLEWTWPNGRPARWNKKYWNRGTPVPAQPLPKALLDVFLHQSLYAVGCYTATKIVVVQGTLDYYRRVSPDAETYRRLERRLLSDGEPLLDIEPGKMWAFDDGVEPDRLEHPGKLLRLQGGVAAKNFVPGDWAYIFNTDPKSRQKSGYEGSNAIYLGGGRFDDYYNDHHHAYTYEEKLDEVYQWRHGVFNRIRDAAKRHPLSPEAMEALSNTPEQGGLVQDWRAVPAHGEWSGHTRM